MQVTSGKTAFPLRSEITDVPGAENWRSMYPYYTRFQPEDDSRFWFYKRTFLLSRSRPAAGVQPRAGGASRAGRAGFPAAGILVCLGRWLHRVPT
jgi:hypothetical protein